MPQGRSAKLKITIITPVFNAAKHIGNCLNSVANQSYSNKEHLVIDGASTDGTLEYVKSFAERFSHVKFISERDNGIYDAMNKGLKIVEGDWVCFLGADDVFYNDGVLDDVFHTADIEKYDLIYGNVDWGGTGEIYGGKFSLLRLMDQNICHQGIFYRTRIFQQVGLFDTRYKIWADWHFNIRCFNNDLFRIRYLDLIVAKFAFGGESSVVVKDKCFLEDEGTILRTYFPMDHIEIKKQVSGLGERVYELQHVLCEREQQLAECNYQLVECKRQLSECGYHLATSQNEISVLEQDVQNLLNSLSWRITKPARKLAQLLSRR